MYNISIESGSNWPHFAKTEFDNLSFYETKYAHIGFVEGKKIWIT